MINIMTDYLRFRVILCSRILIPGSIFEPKLKFRTLEIEFLLRCLEIFYNVIFKVLPSFPF